MTLEDRLQGWGACMRMRRQQHATGSQEGAHHVGRVAAENHWPQGAPKTVATRSMDMADALIVDGAVAALPLKYNVILRAHYVGQGHRKRMLDLAAQVGFQRPTLADVDAMLAMGRSMLARQLELPAVERKERARGIVLAMFSQLGAEAD